MSTNRTPGLKRHVELSALEPRMLFDGAGMVSWDAATAATAPPPAEVHAAEPAQIVFISPEVADPAQIRQAFGASAEVIQLTAGRDGIDQISEILAARRDIGAIHLVSHGADGFIELPGQSLTSASLDARAAQVAAWSQALTADADILVYGCDVAASAQGVALAARLAELTGADVAASSNDTGNATGATPGADWTLEYSSGAIAAPALFSPGVGEAASYANRLATINLTGSTGWTTIMKGPVRDPFNDTQAGAADTDIIGDTTHGSLYTAYDDKGTAATGDDTLVFRMRIDNPTSVTNFSGVAIVGMDANLDGRIDLFFSVDGRNNGQAVRLLDPGTGANISPNTTSTSALPTGWLPNNGVYAFAPSNYAVVAVSAATDPDWGPATVPAAGSSKSNLTGAGGTDVFINWRVPIADIAIVLAKPSLTDRSGAAGPRGASGIANYGKDTVVQYISFTQTQTGPINGDLNGVGAAYDKNATFAQLGAFTSPMSAANPVPDGLSIAIKEPVGDGKLAGAPGSSEAAAVTLSGSTKAAAGASVSLVITDSGAGSASATATVVAGTGGLNTWSVANVNLAGLAEGTLTVTAAVTEGGSTVTDTATVLLDKTGPLVAINQLAGTTAGTPTLSGASDLPDGSVLTLTLDPDNNPGTANVLYQVVVAGGAWTLNTATATPVSGSLPAGGLTATTKITASATDAAGNVASAVALNRPTVTSQSTGSTSPTIGGSWTNVAGDVLTVKLYANDGVTLLATYNLAPSGNTWSVDLASAIKVGGGTVGALAPDQTYQVVAEVKRGGATVADITSGELTIIGGPSIDIIDNDGQNDDNVTVTVPKPAFTGTSSVVNGFITLTIDPAGNGTADRITYSVATNASGDWTLDTAGGAQPVSGSMPVAGLSGSAVVVASTPVDASGQSASNTQSLSVVIPGITLGSIETTIANGGSVANIITGDGIFNIAEDDSVVVSGTTTSVAQGTQVVIKISDGTLEYTKTTTVLANGSFTLLSSGAGTANDGNAFNLSGLNSTGLTVTATVLGTSATRSVLHDKIAPQIILTTPSIIKTSSPVVTGNANLPAGSPITIATDYSGTTFAPTVDANGDFTTTLSLSSNGTVKIIASSTATDTAGNKVANAEQTVAYQTPNTNPPVVAITTITGTGAGDTTLTSGDIIGGVTIGGTFANTKTTSSGTLTLSITDGVNTKTNADTGVTLTRNINGTWSAVLTEAVIKSFNNGTLIVKAQLTDTVGAGAGTFYTVSDVTQPTLLLVTGTPSIAITDVVDANGLVNASEDDSVTIKGRAVNATGGQVTVTVSDGDNATVDPSATATVADDGTWSVTGMNLSALNDGVLTVAAVVDPDRNPATNNNASTSATVLHDKTAPVLNITAGAAVGNSLPLITGTSSGLGAGSTVTVTINSDRSGAVEATYSTTVQADGSWRVQSAIPTPTDSIIIASAADPAGNASNVVATSIMTVTPDSGTAGDFITNNRNLSFSGSAALGAVVTLRLNGAVIGTPTADATTGVWTFNYTGTTLANGSYTLAAATTVGGNGALSTQTLAIDAQSLAIGAISSDSGSGGDYRTSDTTLVFNGTATTGAMVTVTLADSSGAEVFRQLATASGGAWSVDRSLEAGLADGSYTLRAAVTDASGVTSTVSQAVVIDTRADIGITTNYKTADTTPVLRGTTDIEAGRAIAVAVAVDGGGTFNYTTTVAADGTWSVDTGVAVPSGSGGPVSFANGAQLTITASGTDLAGNSATSSKAMVVDTAAPVIAITTELDYTGSNTPNGILVASEDTSVILRGSTIGVPDGATLSITITDGVTTLSDSATVSGNAWQLAPANLRGLANGTITVTATYLDAGGTPYVAVATVLHDKSILGANATIDSISTDSAIAGDFITLDNTLVFNGSAAPGAVVKLTMTGPGAGGNVFSNGLTVTADAGGAWRYDFQGSALADGSYVLSAQVGVGTVATQAVVIDTAAPAGPLSVVHPLVTSDSTPQLTGSVTLGAGETLAVTVNGKTYLGGDGRLSVSGGIWTLQIPAADALTPASAGAGFDGVYQVVATIRDIAGNVLTDSSSNELTVQDLAAPAIDLAPANGATVDRSVTSTNGAAVSLDDGADPLTLTEASDKVARLTLTAGGLIVADGAGEKLVFGSTVVAADGSDTVATRTDILVGGVRVNLSYAGGVFSIQRYDFAAMSAAEAQAVARDIVYRNDASSVTAGARTFAFSARDDAGNAAASATATVNVSLNANVPAQTVLITSVTDDVAPLTGTVADGGATNDSAPALAGTISAPLGANEVVAMYRNGVKVGNASVTGTGWTYADSGLADGVSYSYTAQVENTVAATSGTASAAYAIVVDTSAPAQTPAIVAMTRDSGVAGDFITSDGAAGRIVSGTLSAPLAAGEVLEISHDGGTSWSVASVANTAWTSTDNGAHNANWTISARITDSAGNAGPVVNRAVVLAGGPAQTVAIVSVTDDVAPRTGTVANGGATNDSAPALAGTISAALGSNEVVGVYRNGVRLGDAIVSGTGWTFADSGLADGATYSYTAQVDNTVAGTSGAASGAYAIVVDTSAPAQSVTIVSMTRDSGTAGDFITSDGAAGRTVAGTLSGALAAGEVLELSFDGGTNWVTASVDGNGWTALDNTVHTANWTITSRIVDAAGNSGGGASQNVVLEGATATSVAITAVTDDVARVTGIVASGGVTNDSAPAISGTLSAPLGANEVVALLRDGVKIGNASVNGTTWSYADSGLANGATYSYTARIENTATPSAGTPSNAYAIVVDTAAPAQGIAIAAMTRDSGVDGDFITSDGAAGRVVSGTLTAPLAAGEVLEISHDGGITWTAAGVTGSAWTSTDSTAHGASWTISARIVDSAGNVGPAVSRAVVLSGAPAQTVAITAIADDVAAITGTVASGGVTNDTAPGVSGTVSAALGPDDVVAVFRNGVRIGNASVSGTAWTFADSGLADGASYSYTARVENVATTQAGAASGAYALTIDASAPAQAVTIVAMTRDTGEPGDFITTDGGAGRTVSGTLSSPLGSGEVLEASFDNGASWVVANVSGAGWSAVDAGTHSANWTIATRITDAAGNGGGAATRAVVLQAAPAQAVGIVSISDDAAPTTGTVANGGATNDTTPLVAGTLAVAPGANEVVAVYRNGARIGTASVTGTSWTYPDSGLADGATYAYTARVENSTSGINSDASGAYSITIDLGAPAQSVTISAVTDDVGPVTGTVPNGGATNDSAPGLAGSLSAALGANEVVALYRDGVRIGTASVTGTAWSYADSGLTDGASYNYTARVENSVTARAGTPSAGYALRVDTSAPAQTVAIVSMERDTDTAGDFVTSDGGAGRTVSGTISAPLATGDVLEVSFDGGASWVPATVGGTGWNAIDNGAHSTGWSIVTRLTDAAGNVGGAGTRAVTLQDAGIVFTPDTLPATEPLLAADANGGATFSPVAPLIVAAPLAAEAAPAGATGPAPLDSGVLAPGGALIPAELPPPVLAGGLRATGLSGQLAAPTGVLEIETGASASGTSREGDSFGVGDIGAGFSINVRQADGSAADKETVRLVSAVVRIDNGLVPQRDRLALTVTSPNITSVFDAATGTMVLSGGASVAEYEKVIRGLKLRDADGSDVKDKRTIRFTIKSEAGQVQQGAKEYRGPEAARDAAPPRAGGRADAGEPAAAGKTGLAAQIANAQARQSQGRDQLLALAARQR